MNARHALDFLIADTFSIIVVGEKFFASGAIENFSTTNIY